MKLSSVCIALSLTDLAQAFSSISSSAKHVRQTSNLYAKKPEEVLPTASFDPLNLSSSSPEVNNNVRPNMIPLVALLAFTPDIAQAAPSPDWGLFEGKTGSLLHPVIMGSMFVLSLSTALKGFQYRRQRTMGSEISALKKTLPNLKGAPSLSAAIAAAEETEDITLVGKLKSAVPIQNEIDALLQERKDLSKMGLKDGHFSQGALLAFLGTAFAIEVCCYVFSLLHR